MPLYRWPDSGVAHMESTAIIGGKRHAVLRAGDGQEGALLGLRDRLQAQGIKSFLDAEADGASLIVPQVANDQILLDALSAGGWAKSAPQILATPDDKKLAEAKPKSIFERKPLLLTSLFFDLGSIAWIISGIQKKRHNQGSIATPQDIAESMVGVVLGLGNVALTIYGKDKSKHPMLAFSDGLGAHLKEHGVILPPNPTPQDIEKSGFFDSVNDYMGRNIIPVLAGTKVAAGSLIAYAGTKRDANNDMNGWKTGAGLIMAGSWLATGILDEPAKPYKIKKEDKTDQSLGGRIAGAGKWLAEDPRGRIAAPSATVNNVMKLWGAWKDAKVSHGAASLAATNFAAASPVNHDTLQKVMQNANAKKYDYVWNVISYCAFLVGNMMFGKTGKSKHKIEDFSAFEHDMLTVASNVLCNIPSKVRGQAIADAADYISGIEGVKESKEQIVEAIGTKIAQLRTLDVGQQMAVASR